MHKRLYTSLTAVTALVLSAVLMVPAFGAVKEQAVDTILLEPETLWEDEVPVDLSWKTQQDKGRWIDEMGIAANNLAKILYQKENKELIETIERYTDGLVFTMQMQEIVETLSAAKAPKKDGKGNPYVDVVNVHMPLLEAIQTASRKAFKRAFCC